VSQRNDQGKMEGGRENNFGIKRSVSTLDNSYQCSNLGQKPGLRLNGCLCRNVRHKPGLRLKLNHFYPPDSVTCVYEKKIQREIDRKINKGGRD